MSGPVINCTVRALRNMERTPDRFALWTQGSGIHSFRELGEMSASFQDRVIGLGYGVGDVVLVMALPGPQLYACLMGLMGLGVGVVFIEPWMPSSQIDQTMSQLNVKAIFVDSFGSFWSLRSASLRQFKKISISGASGQRRDLSQFKVVSLSHDLPAIISFTTGTTGLPKGVVRTHQYLWTLHSILEKYGGDVELEGPDLSIFPNLVLYHLGTGRGSILVPPHWKPSVFQQIRELNKVLWPQSLSCGPAFLRHLLDQNAAFESLKKVHVGGALVECDLLERALLALPRAQIRQVYGGTEVEPVSIVDVRLSIERSRNKGYLHALNVGEPIEELSIRFDEQSVLWVSGPNVCPEYVGNPAESALIKLREPDGTLWHCTGDRILRDSEGLWYLGRGRQTLSDFIAEQKIYAKIGHTRLFIHRDAAGDPLVVVDDDAQSIVPIARDVFNQDVPVWAAVMSRDRRHRSRIDRHTTWEKGLRMLRWWTYLKERSPLPVLFILALGPIVSGYFLAQVGLSCRPGQDFDCSSLVQNLSLTCIAFAASVFFMVVARMMDEVKDIEKDKFVNPKRPLPRGLITLKEMNFAINFVMFLLVLLAIAMGSLGTSILGVILASAVIYLWLMYKEFFIGNWLSSYPVIYALSHQIVVIPLFLFSVSIFAAKFAFHPLAWAYVGINLLSSLAYEFSRKLAPQVHPLAGTYRQIYGLKNASFIAFLFQFSALIVTYYSYQRWEIYPAVFLVQIAACFVVVVHGFRDGLHKYCEGFAALSLILAAWLGIFVAFRL